MTDLGSSGSRLWGWLRHRRGSVSVMAAVMFPVLIGMAGLVTEYGNGLMLRQRAQRMADIAAYAGAMTYNATSSTTAMTDAVARIAVINGYASANVTPTLGTSPSGDGNQAVLVTVTSSVTLGLSTMIKAGTTLPITATAYAEIKSSAIGCIIALNGSGTGVTLSGGAAVTASACAIDSNASVVAPNGTSITTPVVTYNSSAALSSTTIGNIHAPSGGTLTISKKPTIDPLANNASVTTATSRIATVAAMTSPSAPTVSTGTDISFGYYPTTTFSAAGCSWSFSNNTWTGTCSGSGPFNFGTLSIGGGLTVRVTNSATNGTYNFSSLLNASSSISFPAGTFNLAKGLQTGGGTTVSFGAGTFNIGANGACSSGNWSINHGGASLSFAGPSTFVTSCGIYNNGGSSTLSLGTGSSSNSYRFGYTTSGGSNVAIQNSGGSITTLGDATGTGGLFQANGMLNMGAGGGSCLTLPAAAAHDINGSFLTAGGTILGSGIYTVNGYVSLGGSGGGDVTCGGTVTGLTGNAVTLVISAASTFSGGSCSGAAFCLAAGYGHVTLTAPTSGTTNGLVVVGPTSSSNTAGATFSEGTTATSLSGVFYLPYGPMTLGGAASVGNGSGQCLELVASQISMTGGTTLASTCSGLGGQAGGTQVVLVQ